MVPDATFGVDYLIPEALTRDRQNRWQDVLGMAAFSAPELLITECEVPIARVSTPPLGREPSLIEIWRARGPFTSGRSGQVSYRANGHVVFGCIALSEESLVPSPSDQETLRRVTQTVYGEIFRCIDGLGFRHLLRIWNYIPEINRGSGGTERYWQFNEARQRSFSAFGRDVKGNVPAACALGSPAGSPLVVYFLAGTEKGLAVENPRQLAAYEYPPQYGPFSPAFSRATLVDANVGTILFVSGTASIVGHSTVHVGDVRAQAREAVSNIRALITAANLNGRQGEFTAEDLAYKVYVRQADHFGIVKQEMHSAFGANAPIVYLHADVCRHDLLLEIEAAARYRPEVCQ